MALTRAPLGAVPTARAEAESTAAVCGESTGRVKRSPKVHVGLKMPPASTKLSTTGIFSKIEI